MMRVYEEMKIKRALNDPVAMLYWARLSALVDLRDESYIFNSGNSEKVHGVQLNFWTKSEELLNSFNTPRLTSDEELSKYGLMFNPSSNIWADFWGKSISRDRDGKMLLDKKIVGTIILKESAMYLRQEN